VPVSKEEEPVSIGVGVAPVAPISEVMASIDAAEGMATVLFS